METQALWRFGLLAGAVSGVVLAGGRPAVPSRPLRGEAAVRHLKEQKLYASLGEAFTAARYRVQSTDAAQNGYTAQNPAHGLRTLFAREGVSLAYASGRVASGQKAEGSQEPLIGRSGVQAFRRSGSEPGGTDPAAVSGVPDTQYAMRNTQVRLMAVGRVEAVTPVTNTRLNAQDNRVDYTHRTSEGTTLTEWYVNAPTGLEHGFLLKDEVKRMKDEPELLAIELALHTELTPEATGDGQRITLRDERGEAVIAYEKLKVWDVTGRVLDARMHLRTAIASDSKGSEPQHLTTRTPDHRSHTLQLLVDDSQAAYPLTVDPTWTQQQKLTASGSASGDSFGVSVALDGDTAVIGALLDDDGANADEGSAYVFVRSGTTWTQQAQLTSAVGAPNDQFGVSVAVSGDTVIVGGSEGDEGGVNRGYAYVFTRSGTTWTEQQKLTASDAANFDRFGYSVALENDTAMVGAISDDTDRGSVYVFTRSGTTWTQQQKLVASDGALQEVFGVAVAIDGTTAIIGAYQEDRAPDVNQGAAYIFVFSAGTWTEQAKLTASDAAQDDFFGVDVDVSGDTAAVTAYLDDVGANADQGSLYIFTRSGTTWSQQTKLTATDGAASDEFGLSVGLEGDTVVTGARWDNVGANNNQGSAYVFTRSGTTWSQTQKLTASDATANDELGWSVALDGTTVLASAWQDDSARGSAYIFYADPDPPVISDTQSFNTTQTATQITWLTDVASSSTVEYRLLGGGSYTTATGLTTTNHVVSLTGLTAGRTYEYRVRSITSGGSSPGSETIFPASGHLQFLTAPNLAGEVLGVGLFRAAGTIYATVTYNNASGAAQSGVQIVSAELASTSTVSTSTGMPANLGTVAAGSSANTGLEFSGGAGASGASAILTIGYSSGSGGSTSTSYRVTLP